MSIFKFLNKEPETVNLHTITLTFKTANGGYVKATHHGVKEIVLYKTCGAGNTSVIHRFEMVDGSVIMYVDEPNKTLVEIQKSAPVTATFE